MEVISASGAIYNEFRKQFPNGHHSHVTSNEIDRLWQRGLELMSEGSPIADLAETAISKANAEIIAWHSKIGKYGELNHRLSAVKALLSLKGITSWRSTSRVSAFGQIA